MTFQESFIETACKSTTNSRNLQHLVREHLSLAAGAALDDIAEAVGIFKKLEESQLHNQTFSSEQIKERRKAVNNVINDVSRICREITGKSIVCTSRKNYTYEAKTPKPRNKPTPPPASASSDVTTEDSLENAMKAKEYIRKNPYTSLRCIMENCKPEEFMNLVRSAKTAIDKQSQTTV